MLTSTLRVDATVRRVKIVDETAGQVLRTVANVLHLDDPSGELHQRGSLVGHLLHKADDQWIVTKAQLNEVEVDDLWRQGRQAVVVETEGLEVGKVDEAARQGLDAVVAEDEGDKRRHVADLLGDGREQVAPEVHDLKTIAKKTKTII